MKEEKEKSCFLFWVPNNKEGREFIEKARKYLNKNSYSIRLRGRTPKIKGGRNNKASIPLKDGKNIALYLLRKDYNTTINPFVYSEHYKVVEPEKEVENRVQEPIVLEINISVKNNQEKEQQPQFDGKKWIKTIMIELANTDRTVRNKYSIL